MDAPPPQEDCLPFVRVAGYLEAMQLTAPRIIEADIGNGFLLLSDLGNEQYLQRLESNCGSADTLYRDAIDALLKMQQRGAAYQDALPPYDEELLRSELALFRDWLCGTHLQLEFSDDDERQWQATCDLLVDNALSQVQVFVHRDYHSRNLMVVEDGNPGILDFQDAVEGPFTYDLVSLLKDCYIQWPVEKVRQWALCFYRQLDDNVRAVVDEEQFIRYFELMGVQRHLKAAGIFCRLNHRDGKAAYLTDVPRTLAYIVELSGRYESLQFLVRLIETRVLPVWVDAG
jgi:aminoglycoside/choline kinase family phosphotransferase